MFHHSSLSLLCLVMKKERTWLTNAADHVVGVSVRWSSVCHQSLHVRRRKQIPTPDSYSYSYRYCSGRLYFAAVLVEQLSRAMDGRIVRCGIISSCQVSCHFRDCKALLVASLSQERSAIASTRPLPFTFTLYTENLTCLAVPLTVLVLTLGRNVDRLFPFRSVVHFPGLLSANRP